MSEQTQQTTREMCPFCKQLIQKNAKKTETSLPKITRQELFSLLYFSFLILGTATCFGVRLYQEFKRQHQKPQVILESKENFRVPAAALDRIQIR